MRRIKDADGSEWTLTEQTTGGIGAVEDGARLGPGQFCVVAVNSDGRAAFLFDICRDWHSWLDDRLLATIGATFQTARQPGD